MYRAYLLNKLNVCILPLLITYLNSAQRTAWCIMRKYTIVDICLFSTKILKMVLYVYAHV